ncbi:hypothetical protein MASR2M39_10260 [Ignavibacteriales bacterium]
MGSRNIDYIPDEGFNAQNEGWLYSRSLGDVKRRWLHGDFLTCLNYYARLFLGGNHKPDDTPIKYYSVPTNIIERVGDVNEDGLDDIGIGVHGELRSCTRNILHHEWRKSRHGILKMQ